MERDKSIPAKLCGLIGSANAAAADELLRRLGRHLILKTPLVDGMGPYDDPDDISTVEPDPQINGQLILAAPDHRLFPEDCDRLDVFHSAWGDSIEEMIFSTGEADDYYAEELFDAFMTYAKKHAIAIEPPANINDEEFRTWLCDDFSSYIRLWRAQVFDLLSRSPAGTEY